MTWNNVGQSVIWVQSANATIVSLTFRTITNKYIRKGLTNFTSEKSFKLAFCTADSAIQFLSTYLGLTAETKSKS